MQRYGVITNKIPREIVLLKARPCAWGKCAFCDYIEDNTTDTGLIQQVADEELAKVTGAFRRLEIINSGSILELPLSVRKQVRDLIARLKITEFICESFWSYRRRFAEIRDFFQAETRIKVGVETFDDSLRNGVLNKGMYFESPLEVANYTDTICLMVGFRGQTRESIARDMDIMLQHFTYGCVNLFCENTKGASWVDEGLKDWFRREFSFLEEHATVEVLWENTDFGVGSLD